MYPSVFLLHAGITYSFSVSEEKRRPKSKWLQFLIIPVLTPHNFQIQLLFRNEGNYPTIKNALSPILI